MEAGVDDQTLTRLAVYGTLAPGEGNHGQLSALAGEWRPGAVRGQRLSDGWRGYPGFILDPTAEPVPVQLFTSPDLPAHWPRLDAFEGAGYRRLVTTVATDTGDLTACIYVLAD
jgi:gamma-glutamylcyclotransferase (GGCT)/AIG2-like uncharacterized protein YtfP